MIKLHIGAWSGIIVLVFMLIFNMVNKTGSIVTTIGLFVLIIIFFLLWLTGILQSENRKRATDGGVVNDSQDSKGKPDRKKCQESNKIVSNTEMDTMTEFKRKIAHSVRMPISIIIGYGDLIKKGKCKPEDEKEYIRKICQNAKYLKLTYKMLLEENQEDVKEFDVGDVVAEYIDQVEEYINKKNIQIKMNRRQESIRMRGNPTDLMRILYNVTENSLKYMEEGTTIYITVDHVDGHILIIYRDDGKGINEKEVSLLTNENYQGSNVNRENENQGFGYGLYMVKEIVDRWNGGMKIKSAEGKGFSLYFFFPEYNEVADG